MTRPYLIGTRPSPLAQIQARMFLDYWRERAPHNPRLDEATLRLVTTEGDRIQDRSLADIGGKALFCTALQQLLHTGDIDIAVHSLKDMEPDMAVACVLPRGDARDALIAPQDLNRLPPGARIGTCSPRRTAQLLRLRPDLTIVAIRGNVQTRLDKITKGMVDGVILAMAGLERLDLLREDALLPCPVYPLDTEVMVPAAGQGVIAAQARPDDLTLTSALQQISDPQTLLCAAAEREVLRCFQGDCRTAVGVYARFTDSGVIMHVRYLTEAPYEVIEIRETVAAGEALTAARHIAAHIKNRMP